MNATSAYVSQLTGYSVLAIFGLLMILITWLFARWRNSYTREGFLVAGREVGWFFGGCSIAASWIWAPALFISSQMAYQLGLAGIFWFVLPNILALAIFAVLGPTIREKLPEGYTLPQYIRQRLQSRRVHRVYLFPYIFYQLMAVTVQLFAGGSFVSLLTGIPLTTVMPIMAIIALAYTSISGLEASVVTDLVQMTLIYIIGTLTVSLVWISVGGYSGVSAGFSGIEAIPSILDPGVAFSFGIVTSIGLIAGAISDQQYWQRSFAIRKNQLRGAFIFGALLFGLVPIGLSVLGFVAANSATGIVLPENIDASLIGVQAVMTLLPAWAMLLFVIMLLAGLCSTLDSGLSAASSLWVTDISNAKDDLAARRAARIAMIFTTITGLAIALSVIYIPNFGLKHLWWVMNTIGACVVIPTILSLYWGSLDERGVFWGILVAFFVGIPLFVYGNIINSSVWIVSASFLILLISGGFCLVFSKSGRTSIGSTGVAPVE